MRSRGILSNCLILAVTPFTAPAQQPSPAISIPVTFSGEVRQRSDWDRPDGTTADLATYLRSRLGLRLAAASNASIFLQAQDSRVLGAEGNTSTNSPDVMDLHQGYLELTGNARSSRYAVRAGRQEIIFGNERLVGAAGWTNTGRSFDGISARMESSSDDRWSVSAFVATIEERGRRFAPASTTTTTTPDHATIGAFARWRVANGVRLETTLLIDDGGHYRSYDHSNRTTVDTRLRVPQLLGLRWEVEGAYQGGRQQYVPTSGSASRQTVSAWLAGARVGTIERAGRGVSLALGADFLSGDGSPTDARYGAFNTMYATNHPFYGLMDLFTDPGARTKDLGLADELATASWSVSNTTTLRTEQHRFARQVDANGTIGWESDLIAQFRVGSAAGIETGYSYFRAGNDASSAGLVQRGQSHDWVYVQLRVGF